MISVRGTDRESYCRVICSQPEDRTSTVWHDVYRCVCSTYHELFYSMEGTGILDPVSEVDLFVLCCVFLPRINRSLTEFSSAWNLHPIRTARNLSPHQIMLNSMIREDNALDTVSADYRIDPEGQIPEEDTGTVVIPETLLPVSDDPQHFLSTVDKDTSFGDLGVKHYMDCE